MDRWFYAVYAVGNLLWRFRSCIDARSKCRLDLSQGNENEKTGVGKFFTFVETEWFSRVAFRGRFGVQIIFFFLKIRGGRKKNGLWIKNLNSQAPKTITTTTTTLQVCSLSFCFHVILNKDMYYGLSHAFCNVPKYVTICVPFQPND